MKTLTVMDELELIRRFHGHLGPNVVFGYRMGKLVKAERPKDITAKVYCGCDPPMSCLIDGIQLSSGCTMGKNNIVIAGEGELRAVFELRNGTSMTVTVRKETEKRFNEGITHDNEDERSEKAFSLSDEELFEILR